MLQKLKDTGKPKKPVSAYVLFLVEYHKSAREKKYAGLKSPSEKFKASKEVSTGEWLIVLPLA